ncbi:hypothetical protein ACTJKJ_11315 [Roseateles sp. 22389]|uniref:hypothetical protein n=1 Tax=Roseateles sp. 22389 TaxID=3453916 RepID=UPI003F872D0A
MHNFQRPAEPENFSARTKAAREKVEAHFLKPAPPAAVVAVDPGAPAAPDSGATQKRKRKSKGRAEEKKEELFPSLWSKHKHKFSRAQRGKCAYCEGLILGLQYGDVEHIQPKAEIHDLPDDPAHWGQEGFWSSSVEGRKAVGQPIKPGYWWRAYDWNNYLLSCQICNQQWKANFFPVDGVHPKGPPVEGHETEPVCTPWLLSPFDEGFDPSRHFDYGRIGEILGCSEWGRMTIATCGLDRPSLRLARYKLARATHEHLDEIARDVTERDVLRVLTYIERDGEETQAFCGMVRTIFTRRTGLPWKKLGELTEQLRNRGVPERSLCDC